MIFENTNYEMNNKSLEQSVVEAQFSVGTDEKACNVCRRIED